MFEVLEQYGLSKREAKVYMAWLNLWSSPGSTIARYIDENRVTVYSILKELVKRWFFSAISRDWITYFSPTPPDILLQKLEEKYIKFKQQVPLLLDIVENSLQKPKLSYYEGIEWLKNLYNEILKSNSPLYAFLSDSDIDKNLQDYLNHTFIQKRKSKNIHASVIVSPWPETHEYISIVWDVDPLTSIKIAPQELSWLQGEIILYGNEYIACALYSPKEMIWFIIKSEQFYQSLYALFNFVWNTLPWEPILNE
jgi:sugar-specific transcriptional regulator TrmB